MARAGRRGEGLSKTTGLQQRLSASSGVGLCGLVGAKSSVVVITGEKMKRAMGLVLVVLGFAVAAHADRMEYGDGVVGGNAGEVMGPQASFTEPVVAGKLADETSTTVRGWSTLGTVESPVRLTDDVHSSQYNVLAKTAGDSSGFDFMQGALDGFPGKKDDGRGNRFGIDHAEPFRRFVGVQEIPEPGTLLLMGMGLALVAVWKRSGVMHADDSDRVR